MNSAATATSCETCDGHGTTLTAVDVNGDEHLEEVPCLDCLGGGDDAAVSVDLELGEAG